MAKTVVIFGATGTQGGSVVDAFLGDHSFQVRAVLRDPKSTSAQALQARGVEVVKGDLFDEASLVKAFKVCITVPLLPLARFDLFLGC